MAIRRASKSSISTTSSGKRSNLIAGYSPAVDEMDLIERVTLTGTQQTITFQNIPQTYNSLHISAVTKANGASNTVWAIRFNNISTATYAWHRMFAISGGITADGVSSAGTEISGGLSSGTDRPDDFGMSEVRIFNYSSTTRRTNLLLTTAMWDGTTGEILYRSGFFDSTAAVNRIDIFRVENSFVAGTTIALYGVRGDQ